MIFKQTRDEMKTYSEELKSSTIAKMLPPHNTSIPDLSRDTGIPRNTLYTWRRVHGKNGSGAPEAQTLDSRQVSSEEKFQAVLATALMTEVEISEYCRAHGLYPEQLKAWRQNCQQANVRAQQRQEREEIRELSKANKSLQAELRRKEKALAETAALLVLSKKVQALWEEKGAKSTSQSASKSLNG